MKKTYYSISENCEYFPVKKKQQNYAIIIKKERRGNRGVGRCLKIGGLKFWAGFVGGYIGGLKFWAGFVDFVGGFGKVRKIKFGNSISTLSGGKIKKLDSKNIDKSMFNIFF